MPVFSTFHMLCAVGWKHAFSFPCTTSACGPHILGSVCMHASSMQSHQYTPKRYPHTHTHRRIHTHTHLLMHTHTYTYMYAQIHTHTHTRTHTHTHTRTLKQTHKKRTHAILAIPVEWVMYKGQDTQWCFTLVWYMEVDTQQTLWHQQHKQDSRAYSYRLRQTTVVVGFNRSHFCTLHYLSTIDPSLWKEHITGSLPNYSLESYFELWGQFEWGYLIQMYIQSHWNRSKQ